MANAGLWSAIRHLLSDGEWRTLDQVAAACGHLILPTVSAKAFLHSYGVRDVPLAEMVRVGSRAMIRNNLRNMLLSGAVERDGDQWRLRPEAGLPPGPARGESHPNAVLNEVTVRAMRKRHYGDGVSTSQVAAEFGVKVGTARSAITGRSWRHIKDA